MLYSLSMKEIILASTSPRRKELMEITGLPFVVVASPYEEDMTLKMKPKELVKHLAKGKAQAVADNYQNEIIVGADTIVVLGKQIMGKPGTEAKARTMLKQLSGKPHKVITGYCIIDSATGKTLTKAVETKVYLKKLSDSEITNYIKSGEPLDKAGAYAIQGLGALFIKKIEGDFLNAVGLPIQDLAQDLKKFGIVIL